MISSIFESHKIRVLPRPLQLVAQFLYFRLGYHFRPLYIGNAFSCAVLSNLFFLVKEEKKEEARKLRAL